MSRQRCAFLIRIRESGPLICGFLRLSYRSLHYGFIFMTFGLLPVDGKVAEITLSPEETHPKRPDPLAFVAKMVTKL